MQNLKDGVWSWPAILPLVSSVCESKSWNNNKKIFENPLETVNSYEYVCP